MLGPRFNAAIRDEKPKSTPLPLPNYKNQSLLLPKTNNKGG
jgi:hypothetical protein